MMSLYEPEWMKSITSTTICGYFYILFLLVAVAAGVIVLSDLLYVFNMRGKGGLMLLLRSMVALALPLVNALFLYILCSRSLLEKK
jgi:hypothetical protein